LFLVVDWSRSRATGGIVVTGDVIDAPGSITSDVIGSGKGLDLTVDCDGDWRGGVDSDLGGGPTVAVLGSGRVAGRLLQRRGGWVLVVGSPFLLLLLVS